MKNFIFLKSVFPCRRNKSTKGEKNGSAIILSVMCLAFFLSMSLNIYYTGAKKAESAIDKVTGEKITNNIDTASSIGYQELYLAENFVRKGFIYDDDHPSSFGDTDSYAVPNEDGQSSYFNYGTGEYTSEYYGIQLNSFSEYFDSHWDYTLTDSSKQKTMISENIEEIKYTYNKAKDDKVYRVMERSWQSGGVPEKTQKLWKSTGSSYDEEKKVSIGGYRLTHIILKDSSGTEKYNEDVTTTTTLKSDIEDILATGTVGDEYSIEATFEKTVVLAAYESDGDVKIPEMSFDIIVNETIDLNTDDGLLLTDVEYENSAISMEINQVN
ncbi:hypothetical protein [Ilyobacter polytropus]|uniref:Uncharacterized protein n=1 Tax=Ilyobacter polytropus (strain ATCC 51220 / DSM 2926 / LMG 16218 / CuHBu1) TaxID=572544 RepID=E3H5Z0_ILYPC|nr:hypothetical protein [Ilyobacter polytropus]ADO82280.1 hypothetical protein Ilyop_0492 [Ilyobacter polytropus DSM 2926]